MKPRFVHDVSALPNHAFGRDSILWWGTLGFMAIEGTGFILAIAAYFYLMREVPRWPPGNIPPPGPLYGSLLTASCWSARSRTTGPSRPGGARTCAARSSGWASSC